MISEEVALAFAGSTIKSVWTLELLFMLHENPARSWSTDRLIRELRSSRVVVAQAIAELQRAKLIRESEDGGIGYAAGSEEIARMVDELKKIYATKPVAVVRAIASAPNEKLRLLSDAFKIKD
ncbi:unnamed protein product [Phaeothamnion confervicola]